MSGISACQTPNDRGPVSGASSRASCRVRVSLGDDADVRRLGALLPLGGLELHLRALAEGLEALAGDAGVVHEQVLRAVFGGDEAVPLLVAEPLHCASCHDLTSPACSKRGPFYQRERRPRRL